MVSGGQEWRGGQNLKRHFESFTAGPPRHAGSSDSGEVKTTAVCPPPLLTLRLVLKRIPENGLGSGLAVPRAALQLTPWLEGEELPL